MLIKELGGEFALLRHILPKSTVTKDVLVPNGDDAAVFRAGDKLLALSTDTFVEGRHFSYDYFAPRQVGLKVLEASASDIIAMGGKPRLALINLTLPKSIQVEVVEGIYAGLAEAGLRLDVEIVGGDTTSNDMSQSVISLSVLGLIKDESCICIRGGAKAGDLIFVSGELGAAQAGLELLTSEVAGYDKIKLHHLEPRCRIDLVDRLAPIASSMIDISDGLAAEIHHICGASKCGAHILAKRVPYSLELEQVAKKFGRSALDYALYSGEDFELLYTIPPAKQQNAVGHQIGVVTASGVSIEVDGKKHDLVPKGFDHFS